MVDIKQLRLLKLQAGDAYLGAGVVGTNALCVLDGYRWEDDGRDGQVLVGPSGPVGDANRGDVEDKDNPGLSVDAALALAERCCPREWPGILRAAVSAQSDRHGWHANFPRPGQRETMARAVLLALVEQVLKEAEEGGKGSWGSAPLPD